MVKHFCMPELQITLITGTISHTRLINQQKIIVAVDSHSNAAYMRFQNIQRVIFQYCSLSGRVKLLYQNQRYVLGVTSLTQKFFLNFVYITFVYQLKNNIESLNISGIVPFVTSPLKGRLVVFLQQLFFYFQHLRGGSILAEPIF